MRKLLLTLNLLPAIVLANPPFHRSHPPVDEFGNPPVHRINRDGDRIPPFLHDMDLSDQQLNEINSLMKAHRTLMEETSGKEHALRMQLRQLSFSGSYNDEKAIQLIDESMATRKDTMLQHSKRDNAIFNLLTDEQQLKLKDRMDKLSLEGPR